MSGVDESAEHHHEHTLSSAAGQEIGVATVEALVRHQLAAALGGRPTTCAGR